MRRSKSELDAQARRSGKLFPRNPGPTTSEHARQRVIAHKVLDDCHKQTWDAIFLALFITGDLP
jgi:hypothetical protein